MVFRTSSRSRPGPRQLATVAVSAVMAVLAAQAAAAPLDQCVSDAPRAIHPGHGFVLETFPGEGPLRWVDAFPGLGFSDPLFLTFSPDGTDRIFVVEKTGAIRVFPNDPGVTSAGTFLDLGSQVVTTSEAGLVGLAFSPDYATSGHFYVNYVTGSPGCSPVGCKTRISRFTVSADPNIADAGSELLLIEFDQDEDNHNGGMMAFGPDGLLYISAGDGGGGNDFYGNAQDRSTLKGNILRIDPSNPGALPYGIPPDNPFVGNDQGWREEIWAYGLRNPWRFSFDRVTGDLWIGDVGQQSWEEVNFIAAADLRFGGFNFGWPICEGTHDFLGSDCSSIASTLPLFEYGRDEGVAVTGGYVYRGGDVLSLQGSYVFSDFGTATRRWETDQRILVADNLSGIASFGEDAAGELYGMQVYGARVLRLEESPDADANVPTLLSGTGLFANVATLEPKPGLIEYRLNAPLWSDAAEKRRWIALPGSEVIGFDAGGNWSFPIGTALVKHFELTLTGGEQRRLETRVFVRLEEGWLARTYRWNPAQTDADLVSTRQTEDLMVDGPSGPEIQTWTYPGPSDCMGCHTLPEGRVLGVRARQLDRDVECDDGSESQLDAWAAVGLLDTTPAVAGRLAPFAEPSNGAVATGPRARAYLASNCALCHQPLGPAPGGLDLRFDTPVSEMNVVGVAASEGDQGLDDPERIKLGVSAESMLWHRMQTDDAVIRMPRGTRLADPLAVELFGSWIDDDLALDGDADGVGDDADNCTILANGDQLDRDADQFGNACDCDFDADDDCDDDDQTLFDVDRLAGSDSGIGSDMDGSSVVDDADALLLARGLALGAPGPSAVPEPSTALGDLAALVGLACLARARRRR